MDLPKLSSKSQIVVRVAVQIDDGMRARVTAGDTLEQANHGLLFLKPTKRSAGSRLALRGCGQ